MRIRVNHDQCTGHARCHALSEELYPLDDVGYSAVDEVQVPVGSESIAREGADMCPEGAIEVVDDC
jgi:ferredoxin